MSKSVVVAAQVGTRKSGAAGDEVAQGRLTIRSEAVQEAPWRGLQAPRERVK